MLEGARGHVIFDGPGSGRRNMAVDEAILDALAATPADRPVAVLRFYQWEPATLSLGYFQHLAERDSHAASRTCPLVRRPSGGGAILHDRELTYSLTVSAGFPQSRPSTQLYHAMHRALVRTLADVGVEAHLWTPPSSAPQSSAQDTSDGKADEPFLCFQRRTDGDVIVGEYKIAGSAQRRRLGAVLQHGSLLLERSPHAPELPGIAELTGVRLAPNEFAAQWALTLGGELGCVFSPASLEPEVIAAAEVLAESKFASAAWNARR